MAMSLDSLIQQAQRTATAIALASAFKEADQEPKRQQQSSCSNNISHEYRRKGV